MKLGMVVNLLISSFFNKSFSYFLCFCLLLISIFTHTTLTSQSIYVTTDTSVMSIGEQRSLDIELHSAIQIQPVEFNVIEGIVDSIAYYGYDSTIVKGTADFEVLSETNWDKKDGPANVFVYAKTYLYTTWKDGIYLIPGPKPILLRVGTPIDTSYQGLAPVKDIIATTFDFSILRNKILGFTLLKFTILFALLFFALHFIRNTEKIRSNIFLISLNRYIHYELGKVTEVNAITNPRNFYSRITSLLRLVLEKKMKRPMRGSTTSMIKDTIQSLSIPNNREISQLLTASDFVKYAQGSVQDSQLKADLYQAKKIIKDLSAGEYQYQVSGATLNLIDPILYKEKRIEQFDKPTWDQRLLAGLIDQIIITFICIIVIFPFGFIEYIPYFIDIHFFMLVGIASLIWLGVQVLYKTICHNRVGQTIGKYLLNIEVVDIHYAFPSFGASVGRSVLSTLGLLFFGAGYYSLWLSPKRLSFHDMVLKTFVIKG